jgi:hypothetical protein
VKPTSTKVTTGHLKIHKQFPVQLACAHTIHRSQGLTLDNVAFDPVGVRRHGLVYTTLSHVRSTKSLYLLSPLTMDNFNVKQKIIVEMQHLRSDANWTLEYDSRSMQLESCISIFSLNTHSLHVHINDIASDYDTMQSDILCIQETYMTLSMQNE